MHHGTCVTHIPWCMPGPLVPVGGKTFPAFPAHAHPRFSVIGKRPMPALIHEEACRLLGVTSLPNAMLHLSHLAHLEQSHPDYDNEPYAASWTTNVYTVGNAVFLGYDCWQWQMPYSPVHVHPKKYIPMDPCPYMACYFLYIMRSSWIASTWSNRLISWHFYKSYVNMDYYIHLRISHPG